MSDLQGLADRVEIEALRGEFTDAVMMREYDRAASLFTPDGALRMPNIPAELTGPGEIRAWGTRVPEIVDFLVQNTHPGTIRLDGDSASGRAYMQELIRTRDGRSEVNYAIYHDRYRRTGDGWKFTERVYEVRYHDTSPLAGSPPADTRADADAGGLVAFSQPELERFAHTFTELFDAAEPTSMTGYYTEQAQLMADGMTPIRGHGAIGQFWRTAISQATAAGARRTIQLHESHSCGDLGYALCTVTVEVPGAARRAVWDTTIWERDSDGNWRIAVDISTLLP